MDSFYFSTSNFDKKYAKLNGVRHPTIKLALNLFLQRKGSVIVETGCCRQLNDWGAGLSTFLYGEFCSENNSKLFTVDLSSENIKICKEITSAYSQSIDYTIQDSVEYLKSFDKKIDFLYLDSYDYPHGELLEVYDGKTDIENARKILESFSEDEIVSLHNHIISGSQIHCLNELMAALPALHENSIILIDDCDLPGGGKGRLAKEWLLTNGYICLLDLYQSLWIKRI